jgi:hypothetical protein
MSFMAPISPDAFRYGPIDCQNLSFVQGGVIKADLPI